MSTNVEAIKLRFSGGVHIGRGSEELDKTATTYSSDALKSALFAVGLPYYPEWAQKPERFFEGFRISSAFPWSGEEYFLPRPGAMRFDFGSADDLTQAKQAKKLSYVSAEIFRTWTLKPGKVMVRDKQVGDGAFLFAGNGKKFLHVAVQQRVQVPAVGEGDTRPYYFERLLFEEGSGLYFLISFQEEHLRPQVFHALQLLGDLGIGTDRTVGNGQFEVADVSTFVMPEGSSDLKMALGLYLPTQVELAQIELERSFWNLVKRGGYMAASERGEYRSLRKNNIYFFGEGSTFKTMQTLAGRFVDLQPAWDTPGMHPVWRCGRPIFLNL